MTRACAAIQPQLSAFIDGQLSPEEAASIAAHLDACESCRGVAHDLERLRATARELGPMIPPAHVWNTLAARLPAAAPVPVTRFEAPARRMAPPWLGLAAALVLAVAGTYVITRMRTAAPPSPDVAAATASNASAAATVEGMEQELTDAAAHYDTAIVQLEAIVKSDDARIDPVTAALLQRNLPVMNQAIAESRAALVESPGDQAAQASLFEALRQKVSVLQDAVELMTEMRRDTSDEAANVAAGMGKS